MGASLHRQTLAEGSGIIAHQRRIIRQVLRGNSNHHIQPVLLLADVNIYQRQLLFTPG